MNGLVQIKGNEVFTDSKVIAEGTELEHHSITRKIRRYKDDFEEFGKMKFMDTVTINPKGGRPEKIYLLNEQQATLLMTYLENNKIVRLFKKKLVRQFFEMRKGLLNRSSTEWLQTRTQGKLARRNETDGLAQLKIYAEKQRDGKPYNHIYVNYTKLVNDAVGIGTGQREFATTKVLNTISFIEDMILNTIDEEMQKGTFYKDIYSKCKENTKQIIKYAYLPEQLLLIS